MGKYFGTDGVRGVANEDLTTAMAYKVGRYLGYYYSQSADAKIVIGKDTRLSSSMLEVALISGCLESGADVYQLGYTTTPSVAYIVSTGDFSCGVMISASHNPYYDNGIKVFKNDGTKISEDLENLLEDYFVYEQDLPKAERDKIGCLYDYREKLQSYFDYVEMVAHHDLSKTKVAIDLANGASCYTAKAIFKQLNINADFYFDRPDGININNNCGSTHLGQICEIVRNGEYSVGFAFDGDADRVLAIDEDGSIVDGDAIMYICGKYLKEQGELNDNTIVTTVMSNIGLHKACRREGIDLKVTKVGDKYVYEEMQNGNYSLGGEQSGHIIFRSYANTGDGVLTAVTLLEIMAKSGKSLKELCDGLVIYPQELINLRVKSKEWVNDDEVLELIVDIQKRLQDEGRILVRTSGTEPLIRVMVEAPSVEICHAYASEVADLIKNKDQ